MIGFGVVTCFAAHVCRVGQGSALGAGSEASRDVGIAMELFHVYVMDIFEYGNQVVGCLVLCFTAARRIGSNCYLQ